MAETAQKGIKAIHRYATPLKSRRFESDEVDFANERLISFTTFLSDGRIQSEIRYASNGEEEEKHEYIYDEDNRLVLHSYSMLAEGFGESFKTERDEKGRVIREVKLYGDDEGESTSYEYDEKGNVVLLLQKDEDGNEIHREETIYNDNNKIASRKVIDGNGKVTEYKLTYNEKGHLSEQEELDDKGSLIARTELTQDEKGNDISIIQYNPKGEITQRILATYDDNGRLVKRISKAFYTRIANFIYDEKDNLIEETTTDDHGNVISRSNFEYDENNRLVHEASFEMDLTHSGRDAKMTYRYEYELY